MLREVARKYEVMGDKCSLCRRLKILENNGSQASKIWELIGLTPTVNARPPPRKPVPLRFLDENCQVFS